MMPYRAAPTLVDPQMLSDQEILRRLRAVRFSPASERNARRAPSINALAKQADLARKTIYQIATTGCLTDNLRGRLTLALTCHRN